MGTRDSHTEGVCHALPFHARRIRRAPQETSQEVAALRRGQAHRPAQSRRQTGRLRPLAPCRQVQRERQGGSTDAVDSRGVRGDHHRGTPRTSESRDDEQRRGLSTFVLFSTGVGDAWLLEPDEHLAMCLVWQGARQTIGLRDDPNRIEVEWDCAYELLGDFFSVESQHPVIGTRAIGDYPLADVRKLLDQTQSTMMKMASVIGQVDAVEITSEVVAQMVKKGWSEEEVLGLKAEGYRYSPGRDSLLGPIISSEDDDT